MIQGVTPVAGVTDVGSRTHNNTRVLDSDQSTIHGVTPLTGVTVLGCLCTSTAEAAGTQNYKGCESGVRTRTVTCEGDFGLEEWSASGDVGLEE